MDQSIRIQENDNHKRTLGIIFIVTAAFEAILMLFFSGLLTTIFSFVLSQAGEEESELLEMIFGLLKYLPPFILIFFSLPSLIAGIGLYHQKRWAMVVALVLGCLKLFSFPVGTAIGIYTIWIYSEEQKILRASQRSV